MNAASQAAVAGAAGAVTTNVLHEITRRLTPDAPRVDLLGMQALARGLQFLGFEAPVGGTLYRLTLAGDLVSNSAYFALVARGPQDMALPVGAALGVLAGIGAVVLPQRLGLSATPTERTTMTKALTVLLYTAGGIAAGLAFDALDDDDAELSKDTPDEISELRSD